MDSGADTGGCAKCADHDGAIPIEAAMRLLVEDDFDVAQAQWAPRARTPEQEAAAAQLSAALNAYAEAFGAMNTTARMALAHAYFMRLTIRRQVEARILEARAGINAEAAEARAEGDEDDAKRLEALPTPDYPGKALDDAWLRREYGRGV